MFPPYLMRSARSLLLVSALLSQSLFSVAAAATFPDVSSSSVYRPAIEALAERRVINGNPDGTFAPERTVNRAEFLTMLYRSKSMNPSAATKACFKDVPADAWFSAIVCDAVSKGFVSGYSDKTFRPQQAVNRVEALKMLFTVLGLSQQTTLDATNKALSYADVSSSAWYMQYLSASFKLRILPLPIDEGNMMYPERQLTRQEAAAYIYNATSPEPLSLGMSSSAMSSSSVSSSSTSVDVSDATSSSSRTRSSVRSSSSESSVGMTQVDYPFGDDGVFAKKQSKSYVFSLKQTTVANFSVKVLNGNQPDDVACRLYKLDAKNGFSLEYYFGYQDKDSCALVVALSAGSYQLDVIPLVADLSFTLTARTVKGDTNDGFVEAKSLVLNNPISSALELGDLADFYKFTLKDATSMMLELTNESNLRCVIYPMNDVDIYGFTGPECNAVYDFPSGTYYVAVMQKDNRNSKQNYSVRFRK